MTRKCTNCSADMIEGVTPASKGWCSAECDLPSAGPQLLADVEVFYTLPHAIGYAYLEGEQCLLSVVGHDRCLTDFVPAVLKGEYIKREIPEYYHVDITAGPGGFTIAPISAIESIAITGTVSV